MMGNFIFLLSIALIFAAATNYCSSAGTTKEDVESNIASSSIRNSNLTNPRFGGSDAVTNVSDSKKSYNKSKNIANGTHLDDRNGKIEEKRGSDESENSKKDINNSSRKKEGFNGEQCDPSNMCTDKEDQFVACLRVPGNDAPHLSLLIQNRGKSALVVTITAPAFVQLEKNKVQLLENEDTKVKVSIRKGRSNNSAITLSSGKGRCSLDLKDLTAAQDSRNDDTVTVSHPSIVNIRPQTLILIISFVILALILVPAIIHVYRNKTQGNKYQRLDMELPVSNNNVVVSKNDEERDDNGWNNDWGDDWDDGDEEQPNTPVLPVTPSVSSRGLASRRLNKEGWKD